MRSFFYDKEVKSIRLFVKEGRVEISVPLLKCMDVFEYFFCPFPMPRPFLQGAYLWPQLAQGSFQIVRNSKFLKVITAGRIHEFEQSLECGTTH